MNPKVSIIILNWNGLKDTIKCLESLKKITYSNYGVILVDNGSKGNDADILVDKYKNYIKLIRNKENLGFAAACNQGIKLASEHGADYVLLLNNDTVVAPDFLGKMVNTAESDRKIGIIGAKIYYHNQPQKIWFAGGDFIWWRVSGKHRFWQKLDKPELTGVKLSDFITGCAILIKKEVFFDIGFFYEPYFLTVEDSDFCLRARKADWKIVVNLDAKIWHKVSSSRLGEFSFSNGYYGTRNRLIFAFKRLKSIKICLGGLIFLFLVIPTRIIQWTLLGRKNMIKGIILGLRDFLRGKEGVRDQTPETTVGKPASIKGCGLKN